MEQKTALVTGGAHRVGEFLVNYLALEGWNVIIHVNSSVDKALSLVDELSKKYVDQKFDVLRFDLNEWKEINPDIFSKYKQIDLLVNNASVFENGSLLKTDNALLERQFNVNFFSPLKLIQSFAECYKSGVIVNILDTKITTNENIHAAYLLAKKSLTELTRMAAAELAPQIRINGIAPGSVLPAAIDKEGRFEKAVSESPLQKSVSLTSIASALKFFIDSDSTTGQIIFCDSGVHLM